MGELSWGEQRIRLRAHKRRLERDIIHYGALFDTPQIERQLTDWREDLKATVRNLAYVETQIAKRTPPA